MSTAFSTLKSALMGASIAFGAVSAVSVMTAAAAQAQEARQFGAKAGELVNQANEMLRGNQSSAAIGVLNQALSIPEINAYERSIINQMLGSAYYEQNQNGQTGNMRKARKCLKTI